VHPCCLATAPLSLSSSCRLCSPPATPGGAAEETHETSPTGHSLPLLLTLPLSLARLGCQPGWGRPGACRPVAGDATVASLPPSWRVYGCGTRQGSGIPPRSFSPQRRGFGPFNKFFFFSLFPLFLLLTE